MQLEGPEGCGIGFQRVDEYVPPKWPSPEHPQQFHLDFYLDDLDVGTSGDRVGGDEGRAPTGDLVPRVPRPGGHPFCLCQG